MHKLIPIAPILALAMMAWASPPPQKAAQAAKPAGNPGKVESSVPAEPATALFPVAFGPVSGPGKLPFSVTVGDLSIPPSGTLQLAVDEKFATFFPPAMPLAEYRFVDRKLTGTVNFRPLPCRPAAFSARQHDIVIPIRLSGLHDTRGNPIRLEGTTELQFYDLWDQSDRACNRPDNQYDDSIWAQLSDAYEAQKRLIAIAGVVSLTLLAAAGVFCFHRSRQREEADRHTQRSGRLFLETDWQSKSTSLTQLPLPGQQSDGLLQEPQPPPNLSPQEIHFPAFAGAASPQYSSPAGDAAAGTSISGLQKRLTELSNEFNSYQKQIGSPDPLKQDLAAELGVLGQSRRDSQATSGLSREEACLLAVVNFWLEVNAAERGDLLKLAADIGITAYLYKHHGLATVFERSTIFKYPFRREDGPWLWVPIPQTGEFWAVPTEARHFYSGDESQLLARLFEGVQGWRSSAQFQRFFRACRLRPADDAGGLYVEVRRGELQWVGGPSPQVPAPPGYEELQARWQSSQPAGNGEPVTQILSRWSTQVGRKLREQTAIQAEIVRQLQALGDEITRSSQFRAAESTDVTGLKQQVTFLQAQVERLDSTVSEAVLRAAKAEAAARRSAVAPQPEARVAAPAVPPPTSTVTPATAAVIAPVEKRVAATLTAASGPSLERLRETIRESAGAFTADAADGAVPTAAGYAERVASLTTAINCHAAADIASVVHLDKTASGESVFEVHETERGSSGEVICRTCMAGHDWQLAVRVSTGDSGRCLVLLPIGKYSRANFSAGYAALITDVTSTFAIADLDTPAELQLERENPRLFKVTQKLSCRLQGQREA